MEKGLTYQVTFDIGRLSRIPVDETGLKLVKKPSRMFP